MSFKCSSQSEAEERYGLIEDGRWANEGAWMTVYKVPAEISAGWVNSATKAPTGKIYCNKDMVEPLAQALQNLLDRGLLCELESFDGCFCIRDVRALPGQRSLHSYGIAIDVNASENKLGEQPSLSADFVACFTDAGFTWGGNFHRKDGMHFSRGWE